MAERFGIINQKQLCLKDTEFISAEDEREILKKLLASRKSQSVFVKRAYSLLALDENQAAGRLSDAGNPPLEIHTRYQARAAQH